MLSSIALLAFFPFGSHIIPLAMGIGFLSYPLSVYQVQHITSSQSKMFLTDPSLRSFFFLFFFLFFFFPFFPFFPFLFLSSSNPSFASTLLHFPPHSTPFSPSLHSRLSPILVVVVVVDVVVTFHLIASRYILPNPQIYRHLSSGVSSAFIC